MATTRPCIVGKMGSTKFFETTMTAGELARSVRPSRETDAWATQSIDERIQRDVNLPRIRNTIVPYLANHPDRFFGSFIILADPGMLTFEPLSKMAPDLPGAYRDSVESIGFLTISGKGDLIALDGQHRLVAFREVITNPGQLGPMAGKVGDDEVCVIFLEFEDPVKTRRIFNKVNRNAKPTGTSDNIITSEDDGYAIVARRLLEQDRDGPLASRPRSGGTWEPVEWTRTTLPRNSSSFTTLSAVYETVKSVLAAAGYRDFSEKDNPVAPPEATLEQATEIAFDWYRAVLALPAYRDAFEDPDVIPVRRHSPTDEGSLLFRPAGQIALAKGLVQAHEYGDERPDLSTLVDRIGQMNWSADPFGYWRDVLVRPDGRMIAKSDAYDLAAELITYMLVPTYSPEDQDRLWKRWNETRGRDPYTPMDEVDEERLPEDLPRPAY